MSFSRITWEIPVELRGFERVAIRNDAINESVQTAVNKSYEVIVNSFGLSSEAETGLADRLNELNYVFRNHSELGPDDIQAPIGKIALGNTVSIRENGDRLWVPSRPAPQTIFLTADSFGEELENLANSLNKYEQGSRGSLRGSNIECKLDKEEIIDTSVQLAISRRLLKYGILPDEFIKPGHLDVGFDRWVEESVLPNMKKGRGPKPRQDFLLDLYRDDKRAVNNLRRTIWREIFHAILPLSANTNQVFFMGYLEVLSENRTNTAHFNDQLTSLTNESDVTGVIEDIYGVVPGRLKSVK